MNEITFQEFPKMARYSRECIITEKIDGTNAQILIVPKAEFDRQWDEFLAAGPDTRPSSPIAAATVDDMVLIAGSRTRWIRPKAPGEKGDPDNYGFAAWVKANASELVKLGPGRHFGEWFGSGINRAYGLVNGDRRFALFNVSRWIPATEASEQGVLNKETGEVIYCCRVVPTLAVGDFRSAIVTEAITMLAIRGSSAQPGFMSPEGIVIFHCAAQIGFKKTLLNDESPKGVPGLTKPSQLIAGVEAANHVFQQKIKNETTQT